MADNGSDTARPSAGEHAQPRSRHTYSRLTTVIAALALATAAYALWRLDSTRDRLEAVNDLARTLEADRTVLRAELKSLATRERQARRELERKLDLLADAPQRLQELTTSLEELRGRSAAPERAWSRAEAMFLLELAQRRLALERDVDTAIVALESADARLAALRDPSFVLVRQQIARDLQALRSVRQPDVPGILARLSAAEDQALRAAVKGVVAAEKDAFDRSALPEGMLARAWAIMRQTLGNLIVVRKVDDLGGRVVAAEEALLRREHLQLLLFAARTSVTRHDEEGYRNALAVARRWLGEFFDLTDPAAQALLKEVQALEPVDVDPPLPEISDAARALRRLSSNARGPE
ncbi:MAG TPA: uroporphyrinogen-III C-methyltransferase [Steroidobacter sp.]|jgi:uroporphyrin-3 C-methyltransferase|nr:uroporphyrinogen-III C-methyltransferase [Steroidobacter sp.]